MWITVLDQRFPCNTWIKFAVANRKKDQIPWIWKMSGNWKTTKSFKYRMCLWIGKTSGQFPYFQGILSPVSRHFTIYHIFQTNPTIRRHIKTPCQLLNNASSSPTFFIIMEYVLSYHITYLTFPLMIIISNLPRFSRKHSVLGSSDTNSCFCDSFMKNKPWSSQKLQYIFK